MEKPARRSNPMKKPLKKGTLSLQQKFLIGMGTILLFFCAVCSFFLYTQEKNLLEEGAYEKSQIVMAAVEATRCYVREVLRPKMYQVLGKDCFLLEAMSTSYVSRAVMDRFKESLPEYLYRRAAINARNPFSEANELEIRMIRLFSEKPDLKKWEGIVSIGNRKHFVQFKPVLFTSSCMHCHGNPENAPKDLVKIYGRSRGFGHSPGDLAGVVSVGIPVTVAFAKIKGIAFTVFIVGFVCVIILFAVISCFFNSIVVHSLKDILKIFYTELQDKEYIPLLEEAETKDEIDELKTVAKVMASHLKATRQKLEEYAANLERMVEHRTKALKESQQALREKVLARSRELQTLNTLAELTTEAVSLSDILREILKKTLNLIPAQGAGIYLLQGTPPFLSLQCHENANHLIEKVDFDPNCCKFILDEDVSDLQTSICEAACGHMSFIENKEDTNFLNVPLCCRGHVLGVMTFTGVDFGEITPELYELLFSIGRQTGITIESLQNLERLVQSKELLQSVFDGITDMLVLLDRKLQIKMVNRAYLKRYGVSLEEALNQQYHELHSGDTHSCPLCNLESAFKVKKGLVKEIQSKSGEIYLVHIYPMLNNDGEVDKIICYAKDITKQKHVEQRIQQTEKLVSLGQLAAGLAHEINNPLGVILCYIDLLKRQASGNSQMLRDIATIEKHALACKQIVSDLLNFARSERKKQQLASVNQTIEEVVQIIKHQFERKNIEIELSLGKKIPMIYKDVDKMKQVYLNLLMNSLQAINGKGKIKISTEFDTKNQNIKIVFWDNGCGIPPGIIDKIFDPFFTTKKTGEGTGLGLSVSYGIVRDHAGEIYVESKVNEWTKFTIILPADNQGQIQ